jgi:hypothetical protein
MNFIVARVHGVEKLRITDKNSHTLPVKRGVVYVTRTVVNGNNNKLTEVPLRLDRQDRYKEWTGCWSGL